MLLGSAGFMVTEGSSGENLPGADLEMVMLGNWALTASEMQNNEKAMNSRMGLNIGGARSKLFQFLTT
mgnify:CR=1 FL=1